MNAWCRFSITYNRKNTVNTLFSAILLILFLSCEQGCANGRHPSRKRAGPSECPGCIGRFWRLGRFGSIGSSVCRLGLCWLRCSRSGSSRFRRIRRSFAVIRAIVFASIFSVVFSVIPAGWSGLESIFVNIVIGENVIFCIS